MRVYSACTRAFSVSRRCVDISGRFVSACCTADPKSMVIGVYVTSSEGTIGRSHSDCGRLSRARRRSSALRTLATAAINCSSVVAMVTRVTQGHSGRPLVLGPVAAFAYVSIQCVAVVRVMAEFAPDSRAWQAFAATGWLLALIPWVLYLARIYLTPRADRQPG